MTDHEYWSGGRAGRLVAVWNGDRPEVSFLRADGAEDHWRLALTGEVLSGHVRPDGYAFGETGFGRVSPRVLKEVRRACERRTMTPAAALRLLIAASGN